MKHSRRWLSGAFARLAIILAAAGLGPLAVTASG
jgi:hypothetical protein